MLCMDQVVSQFPAEYFRKLPGFNLSKLNWLSGVFLPFVGHFYKQVRERGEVKLTQVIYEVWLVSYLFFSFQIWYFRKCIITSSRQSKHMKVTSFNPLWSVSGSTHPQIHHHTSHHSLQTYRFHNLKFQNIITIYKTYVSSLRCQ